MYKVYLLCTLSCQLYFAFPSVFDIVYTSSIHSNTCGVGINSQYVRTLLTWTIPHCFATCVKGQHHAVSGPDSANIFQRFKCENSLFLSQITRKAVIISKRSVVYRLSPLRSQPERANKNFTAMSRARFESAILTSAFVFVLYLR